MPPFKIVPSPGHYSGGLRFPDTCEFCLNQIKLEDKCIQVVIASICMNCAKQFFAFLEAKREQLDS